jgi:hypothetical protein
VQEAHQRLITKPRMFRSPRLKQSKAVFDWLRRHFSPHLTMNDLQWGFEVKRLAISSAVKGTPVPGEVSDATVALHISLELRGFSVEGICLLAVHAYLLPCGGWGLNEVAKYKYSLKPRQFTTWKVVSSSSGKSPTAQHQIRCRPSIRAIHHAVSKTRNLPELPAQMHLP